MPLLQKLALAGLSLAVLSASPAVPGWNLVRRTDDRTQPGYVRAIDSAARHGGKSSATIQALAKRPAQSFGVLTQAVTGRRYVGKRVRLTGWVKGRDLTRGGLWLRVDGDDRLLAFDNMQGDRPLTGSFDWQLASVVLDVPGDAVGLHFGALVIGEGQLWLDDLTLETVPATVPTTAPPSPGRPGSTPIGNLYAGVPDAPSNLDFER